MAKAKEEKSALKTLPDLGTVKKGFTRVVRIKSDKDGFRRAGVSHSKAGTDHALDAFLDAFDEDQIHSLLTEPRLTVSVVDVANGEAPDAPV